MKLNLYKRNQDKQNTPASFWARANKDGTTPTHRPELGPCWEWTGHKQQKGYGVLGYLRMNASAHRIAWLLTNGPAGRMQVLHKCDNPGCVNPSHLFLGTNEDNVRDKVAKGREYHPPIKTHCAKGHPRSGDNLYIEPASGHRRCLICKKETGRIARIKFRAKYGRKKP